MQAHVYDKRICTLGEGPFWHPERAQLFWFDIVDKRMLSREGETPLEWRFEETVSAAGWIDRDQLLIASASELFTFNIETEARTHVVPFEADNPMTRSNDGRADPHGGFWIGSMGCHFEPGAGAIHRYYKGELRQLYDGITVANSICFAPDGSRAYWTDTMTRQIMVQPVDSDGWPDRPPEVLVDLRAQELNPDGAIVDSEGAIWSAHWNANKVVRYLPDGTYDREVAVPGRLVACPEFGGPDLATLYIATARLGMKSPAPKDGLMYQVVPGVTGLPEYRVHL